MIVVMMIMVCGVDRLALIPVARRYLLHGSRSVLNSANLCLARSTEICGLTLLYPPTSADLHMFLCNIMLAVILQHCHQ